MWYSLWQFDGSKFGLGVDMAKYKQWDYANSSSRNG
jgi:hypothetical protein